MDPRQLPVWIRNSSRCEAPAAFVMDPQQLSLWIPAAFPLDPRQLSSGSPTAFPEKPLQLSLWIRGSLCGSPSAMDPHQVLPCWIPAATQPPVRPCETGPKRTLRDSTWWHLGMPLRDSTCRDSGSPVEPYGSPTAFPVDPRRLSSWITHTLSAQSTRHLAQSTGRLAQRRRGRVGGMVVLDDHCSDAFSALSPKDSLEKSR